MLTKDKAVQMSEVLDEVRRMLLSIAGAVNISETIDIGYIVVVKDEASKENVEKVGAVLSQQAAKFGFELEITPATEEDIKKAQEAMIAHKQEKMKLLGDN